MSDYLETPNGMRVTLNREGCATIKDAGGNHLELLGSENTQALREFFRAERDEELGRVRWPENPDIIIYPQGSHIVAVIDETDGDSYLLHECDLSDDLASWAGKAARWWFDSNPTKCQEYAPVLHKDHIEGSLYEAKYIKCDLKGPHDHHQHTGKGFIVTWENI